MAIQMSRFRNYNQKAAASELLAKQMANEQEDEAGFSQFMSIAAPLAASLILPGVGTALVGGLGGMLQELMLLVKEWKKLVESLGMEEMRTRLI